MRTNNQHPNLPAEPLWGEQTGAALELWGYGPTPSPLIQAMAEVKKAAVLGQAKADSLYPEGYLPCLLEACDEIIQGQWDAHFPLELRMGSAGTSLHMNLNEVLCSLANQKFRDQGGSWQAHFLDHINRYQSTNDVIPTALTILLQRGLNRVEEEVVLLQEALVERENRYDQILILGRTELQDALPMKLGQIFAAWAGAAERDRWRIHKLKERCRTMALGGTALGTCFSAPRDYVFEAERSLRDITGLSLSRSQNLTDEVALQDKTAEVMGGLSLAADNIFKISGDLLLYGSSFLGELPQPELLYGSTIMAGKNNPVLCEYLRGVSQEVRMICHNVSDYCRQGQFQLNAWLPFVIKGFLEASDLLEKALVCLNRRLLPVLEPDLQRIQAHLYRSPALIQALRPWLPYDSIKLLSRRLKETDNPPADKESWIRFLLDHPRLSEDPSTNGESNEPLLSEEFLSEFLDSPALTGFYRKEL